MSKERQQTPPLIYNLGNQTLERIDSAQYKRIRLALYAHEKLVDALKAVHARRIIWPAEIEEKVVNALKLAEGE